MAAEETLKAIITVADRTAAPLAAIRSRFAAFAGLPQHITQRFKQLGEETGLTKVGEHAKGAAEHVRRLHGALTDVLRPLAALSALGSFAGLAEAVKRAADLGEHIGLTAKTTGLTAPQLGGLEYAASLRGIPAESVDRGLANLNRTIALAAMGKAKDAEAILNGRLGLQNTPGHLVAPAAALSAIESLTQKLVASRQTQLATAIVSALLGGQRGERLLPVLAQGRRHLHKLSGEALSSGYSMTDAEVASAGRFEERYRLLDAAVVGLRNSIAGGLFPVLTPIIAAMTAWTAANRQWLAANIGEAVKSLAATLRSVDWGYVTGGLKGIAAAAGWVASRLGFYPTLGLIATVRFAGTILEFGRLSRAIAVTAARLLLFPTASFIAAIASQIPKIASLRDAWFALDAAMSANPLGAAIVATTALAAGAYALYEHWAGVKEFFEDLWAGVKRAFADAWVWIKPIIDRIANGFKLVEKFFPSAPSAASYRRRHESARGAPGAAAFAPAPGAASAAAARYRAVRESARGGQLGAERVAPHVARPPAPYAATPAEGAFLKSLAGGEARSYSELYGGGSLKGLPTDQYGFPLWAGRNGPAGVSRAAGFYQFEPRTWDAEARKLGLKNFSPKSQDIAAWDLAATTYAKRTHRDLAADLALGHIKAVASALHGTWTSANGAFTKRLTGNLASLSKPIGRSTPAKGKLDVNVRVDHRNPPPGVTASAGARGDGDYEFGFAGGVGALGPAFAGF